MEIEQEEFFQLQNKIASLEGELKRRKDYDEIYREEARNIIAQFWCWFCSGNHKRDITHKEEGEKYADSFFNDLLKETGNIE